MKSSSALSPRDILEVIVALDLLMGVGRCSIAAVQQGETTMLGDVYWIKLMTVLDQDWSSLLMQSI